MSRMPYRLRYAARQLPGRGPTDVDVAQYLHVNKKSCDVDDDEIVLKSIMH